MNHEYLLQVLCLLTLVAVPIALSKKSLKRTIRLALAMFPVIFGTVYALMTRKTNGIFVALIGLWAVFFVMANRKREEKDD